MYGKPGVIVGSGLAVTGFYSSMAVLIGTVAILVGYVLLRLTRRRSPVDR